MMSLHYLVKLEMLIGHVLPLSCYRKKLQNLFHPNCGPKICHIWIQLITACGTIANKMYKVHITDLNELTQRLKTEWAKLYHVVIWQPFVSDVVDSFRSLMRVLYTFSCNISYMLLPIAFKSGISGGHSWGGINSGVCFCNNSTIVCAQWAFQVSQGSVEALFRWGRKCLHFAANLFRKPCTKFHQNRPNFLGDIHSVHILQTRKHKT